MSDNRTFFYGALGMNRLFAVLVLFCTVMATAQTLDTISTLEEIQLSGYQRPTAYLESTRSVGIITRSFLNQNSADRLLESFNLQPGVRMEERSPGSYRIQIRGSSIRSPYGVRNVKIYLDEFTLSDATGNTYINLIDPHLISSAEIYKGPEASDFGAVTGGTILLKTRNEHSNSASVGYGTLGSFQQHSFFQFQKDTSQTGIFESTYNNPGYREHSSLTRKNLVITHTNQYHDSAQLKGLLFLSALDYLTPGGLTQTQMERNRRAARPESQEQQAGIYSKNILVGIAHTTNVTEQWKHFFMTQTSLTGLENPFITNYEEREELSYALRTSFSYEKKSTTWNRTLNFGYETASTQTSIRNFTNHQGIPGLLQAKDQLSAQSGFLFLSHQISLPGILNVDAGLSYNTASFDWKTQFPTQTQGSESLKNSILPSLGISAAIAPYISLRGKVNKGSSTPSSEEIRSSDQRINTDLNSEYGWNKEIAVRAEKGNSIAEISFYHFKLKEAITRSQNSKGEDYFQNAGEVTQKGLEFLLSAPLVGANHPSLPMVHLLLSGMVNHFIYQNYIKDGNDYSLYHLPGTPNFTLQGLLSIKTKSSLRIDYSHYYTDKMFLDDANKVIAPPSHFANLTFALSSVPYLKNTELLFRISNLYNSALVLGYDINAFGKRYYNPAPMRAVDLILKVNF